MTQVWPEIPELVALYDIECAGRWDYDFYLQLAASLEVDTVQRSPFTPESRELIVLARRHPT